ncbi:DUF6191 domain-containing protein [Streptomyces sp. NPDC053431]|uniref:DUF6191 domain-containing protein n=1 Tax=Streptomyces sp. NPDC053431 TaxID=3365703 RepID=UPI0037CD3CE9
MFNLMEELFAPGRKHTEDERQRLALTREDLGEGAPHKGPIDLASGKVVVRIPGAAPAPDAVPDTAPEAEAAAEPEAAAQPETLPDTAPEAEAAPAAANGPEPEVEAAPEPKAATEPGS